MSHRAILLRETLISMAINAAITAAFFFALFGLGHPIAAEAYGRDFLPQSFMVALMGTLIPGLLLRRVHGGRVGAIVMRSVLLAAFALGLGVLIFLALRNAAPIDAAWGLALKLGYSVGLSAIVTPIAVRAVLIGKAKVPA